MYPQLAGLLAPSTQVPAPCEGSVKKGAVVSIRKSPPPCCCLQTLTFRGAGGASPSGIWKEALAKGMDNVLPSLHHLPYLWGQTGLLPPAHGLSSCPHPFPSMAHSALPPSSTSCPNSIVWGLMTRREQRIRSQEQSAYRQSASFPTLP